jgi:hypothetical protein
MPQGDLPAKPGIGEVFPQQSPHYPFGIRGILAQFACSGD